MSVSIKNTVPIPMKDVTAQNTLSDIKTLLDGTINVSIDESLLAKDATISTTNDKLDTINTTLGGTLNVSVNATPNQSAIIWSKDGGCLDVGNATGGVNSILFGNLVSLYGNGTSNTTLTVQYSPDNGVWFSTNNSINVVADQDFNLEFWSAAPYFRVINSGTSNVVVDLYYGCRS